MWGSHFKINFQIGVLALMQSLAPPVLCLNALFAVTFFFDVPFSETYLALGIIAGLLCTILMRPELPARQASFSSSWSIASQIGIAWLIVVGALLLLGYATKTSAIFSRRALFSWFLLTPVLIAGVELLLRRWISRLLLATGQSRSAVIGGANRVSRRLLQSMRERPELGLNFKGLFDDRSADRLTEFAAADRLGRFSDMAAFVREHRIDTIFIATPFSHLERTEALVQELQDTTASIYYVPDIFVFELIQSRTTDLNGIPVLALRETPIAGFNALAKRTSDIVLASLMLAVAVPLFMAIAVAVSLTTPGSVIFRQRRYGLDGEEIIVYKFRTMTVSEDGHRVEQATAHDPRVTPFGRFLRKYSLDELPQLINVIQGRMSLVGPRPHAVAHNEAYRRLIDGYMVRHKVAPGITGLAQVNGCRGETSRIEDMQRRVEYDLQYLRHWSLLLDLKILARTFVILFRDDKAY
jgi:putative colanic acid biosynthesis UDP-glucose lipid carrier transferase